MSGADASASWMMEIEMSGRRLMLVISGSGSVSMSSHCEHGHRAARAVVQTGFAALRIAQKCSTAQPLERWTPCADGRQIRRAWWRSRQRRWGGRLPNFTNQLDLWCALSSRPAGLILCPCCPVPGIKVSTYQGPKVSSNKREVCACCWTLPHGCAQGAASQQWLQAH